MKNIKKNFFEGRVLEIGVGRGNDLKNIIKNFDIINYYGLDLGENLEELSKSYKNFKKYKFIQI